MTDNEWKEKIKTINDPKELLQEIEDNLYILGFDPYYSDLKEVLINQIKEVLKRHDK